MDVTDEIFMFTLPTRDIDAYLLDRYIKQLNYLAPTVAHISPSQPKALTLDLGLRFKLTFGD